MDSSGIIVGVKGRRGILLAALGFGLVTVLVLVSWPPNHGPAYQGKTLDAWLLDCAVDDVPDPRALQAIEAVRHIGTNGLPFLLKRLNYETPGWKRKLPRYMPRGLWAYRALRRMFVDNQAAHADRTVLGFQILREEATPAIPALSNLMSHYERRSTSLRALASLSYIGTNGLMTVVAVVTNSYYPNAIRSTALSSIYVLGTDAAPAVPTLLDFLDDPTTGHEVALKLGGLKLRPEIVVPALIKCLQSANAPLAGRAANVLAEFGPEASNAVPDLLMATTNADAFLRFAATNALQAIAPEVYGSPEH